MYAMPARSNAVVILRRTSGALMESMREAAPEKMPAAAVLAPHALPATQDARAESPPGRVPGRISSSQTPAGGAGLQTLPAEYRAGQLAPQGLCRCGACVNVSTG